MAGSGQAAAAADCRLQNKLESRGSGQHWAGQHWRRTAAGATAADLDRLVSLGLQQLFLPPPRLTQQGRERWPRLGLLLLPDLPGEGEELREAALVLGAGVGQLEDRRGLRLASAQVTEVLIVSLLGANSILPCSATQCNKIQLLRSLGVVGSDKALPQGPRCIRMVRGRALYAESRMVLQRTRRLFKLTFALSHGVGSKRRRPMQARKRATSSGVS